MWWNTARGARLSVAVVVLTAIMAPTAIAGASGAGAGNSSARATLRQIKALRRRASALAGEVAAINARLAALEGPTQAPATALPSGPAGGALTGSYPNPRLRADTVSSPSIVNGSIAAEDIAASTIQSSNIAENTILSGDIADEAIQGADLAGASVGGRQLGGTEVVKSAPNLIGGNASGGNEVACPPGERLLGGGAEWATQNTNLFIIRSVPEGGERWAVFGRNSSNAVNDLFAYALCLR